MSSMTHQISSQIPPLRLAVQTLLLPGETLEQQFANAQQCGFDAVEVCVGPDFDLGERFDEVRAAMEATGVPVAAICTHPIHDPMEGGAAERRRRLQTLSRLIEMADALGATGVVSVPVRSRDALTNASSLDDAIAEMSDAVVTDLAAMVADLPAGKASLFLEPLNRYEAWYLNRVEQATVLANRIGSSRVHALADAFHMNIEESDLGQAIRDAGPMLGHVHVADNNRFEPGAGCLDFRSFFRGLQDIGYDGYVSIECFSPRGPVVSGPADSVLPVSVQFMRSIWAGAQGDA